MTEQVLVVFYNPGREEVTQGHGESLLHLIGQQGASQLEVMPYTGGNLLEDLPKILNEHMPDVVLLPGGYSREESLQAAALASEHENACPVFRLKDIDRMFSTPDVPGIQREQY